MVDLAVEFVVIAPLRRSHCAAAPAAADSSDDQFIKVLNANGLGCGQGPLRAPSATAT
jgi:hypothetical protein